MGRTQLTWSLLQILILWEVSPFFTEAAKGLKFDLNELWTEDEANIDEIKDSNIANNNENTSSTSGTDTGPSKVSRGKSRINWKPYVPAETSDSKLETLIKMEQYMVLKSVSHHWDYAELKQDAKADITLCLRIWATLKMNQFAFYDKKDAGPACSKAIWKDLQYRSGRYYYIGHYQHIDVPNDKKIYYLNAMRCECSYKIPGVRYSVQSSNTYFLLHKIVSKHYLILSPVNPDLTSYKDRSNIKLVDIFQDPS